MDGKLLFLFFKFVDLRLEKKNFLVFVYCYIYTEMWYSSRANFNQRRFDCFVEKGERRGEKIKMERNARENSGAKI